MDVSEQRWIDDSPESLISSGTLCRLNMMRLSWAGPGFRFRFWSLHEGDFEPYPSGDIETAARCLSMVAAFLHRNTDDFGKKRFYYQASFRMMGGSCRKRATIPKNESFPFSFLDCCVTA